MEKRLFRIKNNQTMLGGVSQGLAEYFNLDVTIIRVVFVLLFFTPMPVGTAYFILWLVLPEKQTYGYAELSNIEGTNIKNDINYQTSNLSIMNNRNQNSNLVGGAILIILGIIFSFKSFFGINLWHYIGQMWPLVLIALGFWLIVKDRKDDNFTNFNNDSNSYKSPENLS